MKVYHTNAFVYKWTNIDTKKWYVGSRTANGCHVDDGYICSSQEVKGLIKENPEKWIREILFVGDPYDVQNTEAKILKETNAALDPMSYNKHNNDGKFFFKGGVKQSTKHIEKRANAIKGIPRSKEFKEKVSKAKQGIPNPKLSQKTKGVPKPNVSKAKKGVPQPKVLCRLIDKKEMCLSHFNRWCNRQDNPEILKKIFDKTRGVPKKKSVCRLSDKKEMTLGHFERWIKTQSVQPNIKPKGVPPSA